MIEGTELFPGVFLRCFQESRFKQSCLSLQLVRPMCRQEAAMNALLPAVLLRGTVKAPDLRDITLRLDDLYGASVGTLVRRVGDYHTTGLYCGFLQDGYTLEGDSVLEPMLRFLGELLLEPATQDGVFRRDFVESEKVNLISTIDSQRNDKRTYCANQMMKRMCSADSFGIPRLGEKEQVAAITAESLYAHYRRILRESRIDLFYVGAAPAEQVADLLRQVLGGIERDYKPLPAQTPFHDGGGSETAEELKIAQGKLSMGFVTPITLRDPRFPAMQVCNMIFGGGMTSKLFMNVRERMSLCYDIGSGYHGTKGILTVSAGIDWDKEDLVRQEILAQLEACANGEITEQELAAAKQATVSSLRGVHDSPGAIEGYYAVAALSGLGMTPAEYMRAVEQVTAQQAAEAAGTLRPHTVYFLKGVQ